MPVRLWVLAVATCIFASLPSAQSAGPESFPHDYPGKPQGDYSPAWQTYFQVTDTLPNVTFNLGRSWAGNIPVQREGHPNDTLFFWAVEKENGSLTTDRTDKPWGIWLNGGPGSSSLAGFHFENGPIHLNPDYSVSANPYSWHKLADYIWIDQPVGVGWGTADANGYVDDEDQMGRDFMGFLANLVKVFPSLATRPLYLSGESYAGVYIPYIMKTYFAMSNPPVKVAKIMMGDAAIGSIDAFNELPTLSVIETYPQIIGYDKAVYNYFKEQSHLCGYDLNMTYPQTGLFPSIKALPPNRPNQTNYSGPRYFSKHNFAANVAARFAVHPDKGLAKRDREAKRLERKRDLTGRANGTIDPWYGCFLYEQALEYAVNFTFPWTLSQPSGQGFNVYDIPDALFPPSPIDATVFLNDNRTRKALHAPTSKNWQLSIQYPFGSNPDGQDPSPEPMVFLNDLATNLSSHNISVIHYSGNDDSLVAHRGTEITIQNTTFGGIQGFTVKPSTPWTDDDGNFAGIIHQERGWAYVLFRGAGHIVPQQKPAAAFTYLREFFLGNNDTGLVVNSSGSVSVKGGQDPAFAGDIMPGQDEIYYGPGVTLSTYVFPSATIAAWRDFRGQSTAISRNVLSSGAQHRDVRFAIYLLPIFILWILS